MNFKNNRLIQHCKFAQNLSSKSPEVATAVLFLLLSACSPPSANPKAQQQHAICKSLIEGFLKAEQLGQYQLQKIQPQLSQPISQRDYLYTMSRDAHTKFTLPQHKALYFQCQNQQPRKYSVHLLNPATQQQQTLLRLTLPPDIQLKAWTAFNRSHLNAP